MILELQSRTVYCPDCDGRGEVFRPVYILGIPAGNDWVTCRTCNGIGMLGVEEVEVLL